MEILFTRYYNKFLRLLRPFHWINVEVTSKCNLKCNMCPRQSFNVFNQDMTEDVFMKLAKEFTLFQMVDLTGWGEPLLHPRLFDFVKIVKEKKCIVKFTTNGVLLDKEKAQDIIELKIEWVVFSIDSPSENTYREIRGTDLNRVLENVKNLSELKKKYKTRYPLIDIAVVISKKNIEELPEMVRVAKTLNANRLLVNNVHVVSKKEDIDILLYKIDPDQNIDVIKRDNSIKEAKKIASELGVNLNFCFTSFEPLLLKRCPLNIDKTMFVSWNGNVSPCCDLGHPVPGVISKDEIIKNTELVFGNVKENTIVEIYNSEKYREFRKKIKKCIPDECRHCMLIRGV